MEQRGGLGQLSPWLIPKPLQPGPMLCYLAWLWDAFNRANCCYWTFSIVSKNTELLKLSGDSWRAGRTFYQFILRFLFFLTDQCTHTHIHTHTCFPSLNLYVLAEASAACGGSGSDLEDILGTWLQPRHSGAGVSRLQSGVTMFLVILQGRQIHLKISVVCAEFRNCEHEFQKQSKSSFFSLSNDVARFLIWRWCVTH